MSQIADLCETCGAVLASDARYCPQCAAPATADASKEARIRELEREVDMLKAAPAPFVAAPAPKTGRSLRTTGWVLFAVQCPLVLAYGLRALPSVYQGGFQGVVMAALLSPLLWIAIVLAAVADSRDRVSSVNDSTVAIMLFAYLLIVVVSGVIATA